MKISDPKFLLKEPKSKNDTLISLFVRFNNERLVYSTGEKINPSKWDFNAQRVINSRKYPEAVEINSYLNKMELEVSQIFRVFKNNGILPNIGFDIERKNTGMVIYLGVAPITQENTSDAINSVKE